jgi:hypothetical protein
MWDVGCGMWDDSQRASGHFKIKFFKIVRSQKKIFYWDIAFEIRMFTLYIEAISRRWTFAADNSEAIVIDKVIRDGSPLNVGGFLLQDVHTNLYRLLRS